MSCPNPDEMNSSQRRTDRRREPQTRMGRKHTKASEVTSQKEASFRESERQGITTRSGAHVRDEAGASLILALIFLLVIGLIVGALASWTSNDLTNSLNFQSDRTAQYALSSTMQVAIQNIRYTPLLNQSQTLNASPPSYCWGPVPASGDGSVSELTVGNDQVAVWCSTAWNPSSASTRAVTVSACLTSVVPTPSSGSSLASVQAAAGTCAATPGLQTLVTFDDYSQSNATASQAPCATPPIGTCGSGMTINSSTSGVPNPTVTALSSTQGPATGVSTPLMITGTGFVSGSTSVNFVATNASSNIVLSGIAPDVTSPTSLSVTVPPATTLGSYYVIVSTLNGSSAAVNQATQFTAAYSYQSVIPTISSIATSSGGTFGSAAGGSALTVTGTGFLASPSNATTVNFVDTANPTVVLAATYLTVNGYQSNGLQTITATTPGISQDSTYYVVVTTAPGGTSAQGPVFTYQPLTPVVASVSPISGGSAPVTITGIGFVSGSTSVQFVPTSGNSNTLSDTSAQVSVSSSTTLTAPVPSGGTNNLVYYVEVTTSTGGASCPSQQNGGCAAGGGVPQYTY